MTPEIVAAMRVAPPPDTPIVERAQPGDNTKILDTYAKRGYIMIGSSMFKSGHPESEDSDCSSGTGGRCGPRTNPESSVRRLDNFKHSGDDTYTDHQSLPQAYR